jgi:thiamine biosynthesis protein ThiI
MKNSTLYLVRLGEISLKGLNRDYFEKRLKQNIKNKLKPYRTQVSKQKGRLYFEIHDDCPKEVARKAFQTTFGVVGFSECVRCEKDMDTIKATAARLIKGEPFASGTGSFKSVTARSDKGFPLSSYQIDCELGGVVLDTYPSMHVDVKHPDKTIHCEIRDKAYLYTSPEDGPGGLPVTTAGKGMLLLSGGIDSPVAGYRMAQRGLKMECIYFHAYPYTSEQALEKVQKLAALISPYLQGTRLHVVPFTDPQLWIRQNSPEDEHTLMFRASMMKVANEISRRQEGNCIVTGEALSQVASQTLESMVFTDSMSEQLVLRPLVGMDKQEIMNLAMKIGTYETSILPYEDCCVIFSPRHPLVKPNKAIVTEHFEAMQIEPLLEKAIADTQTFDFDSKGNLLEHRDRQGD